MRKVFVVLLVSPLVLILGVYGCIRIANPSAGYDNIRIFKETTHILEPLDETGMVDFVESLNQRMSRGVTPENNAAVLLWQAAGPAEILSDVRDEFFERLGIKPLPDKGDYLISFDDFVQAHPELLPDIEDTDDTTGNSTPETLANKQFEQALRRPWSAEEFPIVAAWLATNQGPLELIAAAADRTHYYSPHIGWSVISTMLPDMLVVRYAARTLTMRAMLQLHQGNVEAAWQDLHRRHRLAR